MKGIVLDNNHRTGPRAAPVYRQVDDTALGTVPFDQATYLVLPPCRETPMARVNLSGLLSRATPYETWRAPVHPTLRRAAIVSSPVLLVWAAVLTAILAFAVVPALLEALPFGEPEAQRLGFLCGSLGLLALLDLAGLIAYIPMLIITRGLREARPRWHWVAFAEVVLGAIQGFVTAVGLAIAALAVVIVLAILCLFVVAVCAALIGLVASASG